MNTSATNENEKDGALPPLTDPGVPKTEKRKNSKVKMLAMLGCVVAGILLILVGVTALRGNQSVKKAPAANVAKSSGSGDTVGAEISRQQAEIKERNAQEAARQEKIKAMLASQGAASAPPGQPGTAGSTPANNAPGAPGAQTNQAAAGRTKGEEKRPMTPRERKMDGPVLLEMDSRAASTGTASATVAPGAASGVATPAPVVQTWSSNGTASGYSAPSAGPGTNVQGANAAGESFAARLAPITLKARLAERLPNLDFLLKQGIMIPCITKNEINTTLPGFVLCQVAEDVYSANNKILLVERGATVFGELTSGLKAGQDRGFVLWSRIDNPSGVTIAVDSPATDQSGASGIGGYVDHHTGERFGAAVLLSLFKDASAALTQQRGGNTQQGGGVVLANSQQTTNDFATEALKKGIDIPPTGIVLPGKIVYVLVARNISFDGVYGTR